MKYAILLLIKIYQITISPDHSIIGRYFYPVGACCFYPTCSDKARASISRYGVFKGMWIGIKQLSKCI
ncbi:MAG: membrane protein insertion efficiency factor [Patescibacteria group bacterium]